VLSAWHSPFRKKSHHMHYMLVEVPKLSSFFFLLSGAEETGGFLGVSLLKLKK
jgi:hypothetical protein